MDSNSDTISENYLVKKFNPYAELGIKKGDDVRAAFYSSIQVKNIKKRIMLTLACDSLLT